MRCAYVENDGTVDGHIPQSSVLPKLLDKVFPVNAVIQVDTYLPGCPPSADVIAYCLTEIVNGRAPVLPREMIRFD